METVSDREHDPRNIPELDDGCAPPDREGAELNRLASPRRISWAEPAYTSREYTDPDSSDSAEVGSCQTDIDGLPRELERTNPSEDLTPQPGEFTAQGMSDRFATEASEKKSNLKPTHRRTNSEPTPTYDRRAVASPSMPNFANPFADPSTTNGRMTPDEMSGRFSPKLIPNISAFHRNSFARDSPSPPSVPPRRYSLAATVSRPTTWLTNGTISSSSSSRANGCTSSTSTNTSSSTTPTRLPPRFQQRTVRYEQELGDRARQAHRNMVENQLNLRPTQEQRDRIIIAKRKKKKKTEEDRQVDLRDFDEL